MKNEVCLVNFKQTAAPTDLCKLGTANKRVISISTAHPGSAAHNCTQFAEICCYYIYITSGIQAT